jgi:hypothetical protein
VPSRLQLSLRPAEPLTDSELATLSKWFWRSCFSHRYGGSPQRNIRRDIGEALKLRRGDENVLAEVPSAAKPEFFLTHQFNIRTVATKSFVLLAHFHPRSFLSGELVALEQVLSEPNRSEYHHCYPRACLASAGVSDRLINALGNFAIISRSENRTISDRRPSEYRELMPTDAARILESACVPESLFDDDYDRFLADRAELLTERLAMLIG